MREVELEILKRNLYNSKHCVCLLGKELDYESGISNIRDDDDSYEIEEKYGYSLEEIFSYSFINTRPETVFKVFKDKVWPQLNRLPGQSYVALKQLEDRGLIKCMITRSTYSMAKKAGCFNVIELKGSFNTVHCSRCKHAVSIYDLDMSKGTLICSICGGFYRPSVTLFGEMIPIDVITKATEEVSRADLLLVLGTGLRSNFCKHIVKYFSGSNLILIHKNKEVADSKAELVIYEKPQDVLPLLL